MNETAPGTPSRTHQSWGAFISIVVIMLMVVVGAFYAWHKRLSDNANYRNQIQSVTTSTSTPNQ